MRMRPGDEHSIEERTACRLFAECLWVMAGHNLKESEPDMDTKSMALCLITELHERGFVLTIRTEIVQ